MAQEIYKKAVEGFLPSAYPTLLEKIDEYTIGKVLIYSKKPRKLLFMRKHKLDFAGVSLQSLLSDAKELSVSTGKSYLFDTSKTEVTKSYDVDADAAVDVSDTLLRLATAGLDAKLKSGVKANLKVTTDFGKICHVSTDMVTSAMSKKLQVRADHPIVRRAVRNGNTMFVISGIYEGEHCNLSATVSRNISEDASLGGGAKGTKGDVDENIDYHKDSNMVVNRDKPTPLAYVLMKLKVTSRGVVSVPVEQNHSRIWHVSYPYPVALSEIASPNCSYKCAAGGDTDSKEDDNDDPAKKDTDSAKKDTDSAKKDTDPAKKGTDPAKKGSDPAKNTKETNGSAKPNTTKVEVDVSPGSGATNTS